MRHLDIDAFKHAWRRQGSETGGVRAGQHQPHTFHFLNGRKIADGNSGVRMRRAQHDRVQSALRRDVGDVGAGSAQQRVVFLTSERLSETEFHGCHVTTRLLLDFFRRPVRFGSKALRHPARHHIERRRDYQAEPGDAYHA